MFAPFFIVLLKCVNRFTLFVFLL